jgi:hypothetical protein
MCFVSDAGTAFFIEFKEGDLLKENFSIWEDAEAAATSSIYKQQ